MPGNTYPLVANFGSNASGSTGATGTVSGLELVNRNAATRWFHLFDRATAPSPGATPVACFTVAGSTVRTVGADLLGAAGLTFTTGVAWGWSSSESTFTAATAADHSTQIFEGG